MISGSLAKRYARALLHLADNAMKRDKFDKDLFAFADLMEQRGDDGNPVWAVLETSYYPLAERKALIQTFGKRLGTDATVLTFLELVMERGRMSGAGQIARHFREMADRQAGRVRAQVTTASQLDPASSQKIKAALEKATGKTVVVETSVDPDLIGGVVTQIGSFRLDRSVKTQLKTLRATLTQS